jgi:hypothetical protein
VDGYALEIGGYGATFKFYPGNGAALLGPTNDYNDVAEDFQVQYIGENHIVTVKDFVNPYPDFIATGERAVLNPCADALEFLLGRFQQCLALVCAQLAQLHVATGHEPFPGEVRMGKLEQIALIEEAQLQRAALHEGADLRALERGDPGESVERAQLIDRFVRDHPPIPDEHHTLKPKVLAQLTRRQERIHVRRVALVHRDRHRTTGPSLQQAVVDLRGVALAIAAVADLRQRTAGAFEVA